MAFLLRLWGVSEDHRMKYQNTSRVLTFAFHALIFACFGALGIYYAFFCAPLYFTTWPNHFGVGTQLGYNLYLELATIGLTLMLISGYGMVQGYKGLKNPNDDVPVVRGFTAFIVEGYIAALFFLANAAIYFDLISGSNLAFIIIMAILFAIVLLIAANIPMVRLYDGKDQKPLFAMMSLGAGSFFCIEAIIVILTFIGMYTHSAEAYYFNIKMFLLIALLGSLIIGGLLIAAGVLIIKKGDKPSIVKLSGYLVGGSLLAIAAVLLVTGALTLVWSDLNCHLEYAKCVYKDPAYAIMNLVVGALSLGAGVAFMIINGKDDGSTKKKPTVQA